MFPHLLQNEEPKAASLPSVSPNSHLLSVVCTFTFTSLEMITRFVSSVNIPLRKAWMVMIKIDAIYWRSREISQLRKKKKE